MSGFQRIIELMYFVPAPREAAEWYSKVFNVPIALSSDPEHVFIRIGLHEVWFHRADSKVSAGAAGQVAYWLVDDFNSALANAKGLGAVLYRGPLDRQDGFFMCQVKDPFGNLLGLVGPTPAGDSAHPSTSGTEFNRIHTTLTSSGELLRPLSVTLWNTEWAVPGTNRGRLVAKMLQASGPEIICVTEGYPNILPSHGYAIFSHEDHGYRTTDGRRKVLFWSRTPWIDVDVIGTPLMPSGRFVCGTTETSIGPVTFIGVCIPWRGAHVRTGRQDRVPWQDHRAYLDGLEEWLSSRAFGNPSILIGDFNQRIPREGQPKELFEKLQTIVRSRFNLITDGVLAGVNNQSIDHVAISPDLKAVSVETFSKSTEGGTKLSDHFGLRLRITTPAQANCHPRESCEAGGRYS